MLVDSIEQCNNTNPRPTSTMMRCADNDDLLLLDIEKIKQVHASISSIIKEGLEGYLHCSIAIEDALSWLGDLHFEKGKVGHGEFFVTIDLKIVASTRGPSVRI